jgi:6,7-dimethyl-8-ribityllumazine synthase
MAKILTLLSNNNKQVANLALNTTQEVLRDSKFSVDTIEVREPLGLLCAASLMLESREYEGLIILGFLDLAESPENSIVFEKILRCFSDLSVHYALPVGFGLILTKNEQCTDQLIVERSKNAALLCLDLINLKTQVSIIDYEHPTKYSN